MLTSVPPNDCMRAREAASARLDGELNELDALRLDAHLSGCADCRAFAADASVVAARLRAAALEPSPVELFVPRRRRVAMSLTAAAATLLIAAATGSSFLLGELVGGRHASPSAASGAGTVASPLDPALFAMLHASRLPQAVTGRIIAL